MGFKFTEWIFEKEAVKDIAGNMSFSCVHADSRECAEATFL